VSGVGLHAVMTAEAVNIPLHDPNWTFERPDLECARTADVPAGPTPLPRGGHPGYSFGHTPRLHIGLVESVERAP
jgi:hypothetical protein